MSAMGEKRTFELVIDFAVLQGPRCETVTPMADRHAFASIDRTPHPRALTRRSATFGTFRTGRRAPDCYPHCHSRRRPICHPRGPRRVLGEGRNQGDEVEEMDDPPDSLSDGDATLSHRKATPKRAKVSLSGDTSPHFFGPR